MFNFLLIAFFLSLGALFKQQNWLPANASQRLNQFVIYICLPAIVLIKIPQLSLSSKLLLPALLPWIMVGVASVIVMCFARMLRWSRSMTGCVLLVCCFGNTSFFGFPMVKAFFGDAGLPFAVVYDVLGSFLSLAIVGNLMIAIYAGEQSVQLKTIVYRVFSFPPFIAIIVAWVFKEWRYPEWLENNLIAIGYLLVPSTMFLVGMHLSFRVAERVVKPLQLILFSKLILLPALAFIFVSVFISPPLTGNLIVQVSLFEAAMPPMVTASVMAIHARLEPELAAAAVGLGLFCSCLTLPVWYFLIA